MVTCCCGMVHDLGRRGFLGALMATAVDAQTPLPASAGAATQKDLALATHQDDADVSAKAV